ncbi:translation initiation factor IF-1 [Candidatus Peregrinibacteria bacterium]|nr:translation initiation factor IF-1 [Candidatus Peregrinibacteria bacterium]
MGKEDVIEVSGIIEECLPGAQFRVRVITEGFVEKDGSPMFVHAHVGGKMRKYSIRILPGDTVTVELSPYNLKKGRITYREK